MQRFIELLKKKLTRTMLADEENEFELFLEDDPALKNIYDSCFSKTKTYTDEEILEAEKSYAVHYIKMHLRRDRS